jgi:hypothetical protein
MKLNKNTQILLGVGALAIVGYFVMKNNQQPKKANASGVKGGATFMTSNYVGSVCPPPQRDWKIVGDYGGTTLYLDNKGIYHWFNKVSGKFPKTNEMITYCNENTTDGDPRLFTPKK